MKCFRSPQTTQEKKQFYAARDENTGLKPRIRGRRKPMALPSSWDDLHKNNERRSWKKYRKTQYKFPRPPKPEPSKS